MAKNNNIIDINGKRYDARTGAVLSHSHTKDTKPKMKPAVSKPTMHDVVRHPAKSAAHHQPIPSKTLMRHAVKKPSPAPKSGIKAHGPTEGLVEKSLANIVVSKSAKSLDPKRLQHAKKVSKSHLITHFSDITSDASAVDSALPAKPLVASRPGAIPASGKTIKPSTTAELLEHAIQQASSHLEAEPVKPRRKHKTRTTLAAASAVLLIAFVGYQEMPSLKLNIASARAGFSADLPNYRPAGYSLGQLSYSPGIVATKFNSNSDQRSYTITQKTSSWDSQALKENFVTSTSQDFQAVESAGCTVYLYGNGNATWVNGGVWYIVSSGGSLTNQQLVQLATSI